MTWWEIVILAVVCAAFVCALAIAIYSKVKHKGGCDCGGACSQCGGCCSSRVPANGGENKKSIRRK